MAMDVDHDSQARLVAQVLNVWPKQTQRMWRWNGNVPTVIDGREPCRFIVRASRVKKVVANGPEPPDTVTCKSALSDRAILSGDDAAIHNWMLAEADRKREKKGGVRIVRGKVTPAPGGCNQKGATG
jgi:hypothetical protein